MKKTILSLSVAVLVFTACKKSNSNPNSGISASLNGKSWQSSAASGYYESGSIGYIILSGYSLSNGDSSVIQIQLPDTTTVGAQDDFSGTNIMYYSSKSGKAYWTDYSSNAGQFKLTSFDKTNNKVEGSFSGTLYGSVDGDTVAVTNGHFSSSYTAVP